MAPTPTELRRDAVRAILADGEIRSQAELREALRARGFDASQPVLSRDLRALRVAKHEGVYRVLEEEKVTPLGALRSLLRDVEPATHFLIVHCEPGAASALARALESEELDGLVGTIAGDDAILVALSSAAAATRVQRFVRGLL